MKPSLMVGLALGFASIGTGVAQVQVLSRNPATQTTPQGDVIVGEVNNHAVYQIGQTFIYSVSPDFENNVLLQTGNDHPRKKIEPKKSWELHENRLGTSAPRVPRTLLMDFQPYQWFHLIDGNRDTYWCSHALNFPDQEEAWIRVDLPVATVLKEIRIVFEKGWKRDTEPNDH